VNPWLKSVDENKYPVIGILSQSITFGKDTYQKNYKSYIMAAYVRFMEGSGARVVPILMNDSKETVLKKLSQVNGVLFPGGHGKYKKVLRIIMKEAIAKNDRGEFFPVFGICLGFQHMAMAMAEHSGTKILDNILLKRVSVPLNYTKDPKDTKMFCLMGDQANELEKGEYLMNYHSYSISPETFESNSGLNKFWDVTSTSVTPEGQVFVNSIEAKKYPFIGTQFHPEKVTQAWNDNLGINHSWESIKLNRYFADLLVKMARVNTNKIGNYKTAHEKLIENNDFVSTTLYWGDIYLFK